METVEKIERIRELSGRARREGKAVGFVPTMGALHAGHASLIDAARRECGFVVVSIFVNPTQFGPGEDFARYPRTPQTDLDLCRRHGADAVFTPAVEAMYPPGSLTRVSVPKLSETLCGQSRRGHFDGVCTVVAKLFNIVQPDRAYFGAKDFQQAAIIRQMARDLDFPVQVVVCPTVREQDGLAMSSRNAYLTDHHRRQAPALYEALTMAAQIIRQRRPRAREVVEAMLAHLAHRAPDGRVDYVRIVDPRSLADVEKADPPVLVALAVKFDGTRLIDNMLVDGPDEIS